MCKIYTKEQSSKLEARLEKFCKIRDIKLSHETDVTRICNQLGILNFAIPLEKEGLDGVVIINKDLRAIAINENLDVQEARFATAHELAHYITESEKAQDNAVIFAERDKIFHGKEKHPNENDMDYIAAAMLVPKNQFIRELGYLNIDLKKISDHTVKSVKENVAPFIIDFFAHRYNVKDVVIIRRIAEVSYYA